MFMETYYLVDFENVHGEGMEGIDHLSMSDHVRLFYTDNAPKVSLDIFQNIFEGLKFETEKVAKGKQSLDMHLISYLGYLIGQNIGKDCAYVIVSKDTDYDHVIEYWNRKCEVSVSRRKQIAPETKGKTEEKKSSKTSGKAVKEKNTTGAKKANSSGKAPKGNEKNPELTERVIEEMSSEVRETLLRNSYDDIVVTGVENIIVECFGQERMSFNVHNKLNSTYKDSAHTKEIYELIKPILKKYAKVTTVPQSLTAKEVDDKVKLNNEVQLALSKENIDSEVIGSVASLVTKHANEKNAKQTIYRSIISKYGQKNGLNIYNLIKKLI